MNGVFQSQEIPALIAPVAQGDPSHEISLSEHLVALSFPTHGLMPPWSVLKFLFRSDAF